MKKKISALVLVLVLALLCFAACGKPTEPDPVDPGINVDDPTKLPESYNITWVVDGQSTTVTCEDGVVPKYQGGTDPTKAADAAQSYTFTGWEPAVVAATADATYTAQFAAVANTYTVTWNIDGVKTSQKYKYGDMPAYSGSTPAKASDGTYSYTFNGWDKAFVKVTGDAEYKAQFTKTPLPTCQIKWVFYNPSTKTELTLKTANVVTGTTPRFDDELPTVTGYTLLGWNADKTATKAATVPAATKNATYYTIFEPTQYVVTWKYYATTAASTMTSKTQKVAYNAIPVCTYEIPAKHGDLTFVGWKNADGDIVKTEVGNKPSLPKVTDNITYTAVYEKVESVWRTTRFKLPDGTLIATFTDNESTMTKTYANLGLTREGTSASNYKYYYTDNEKGKKYEITSFRYMGTETSVISNGATVAVAASMKFVVTDDGGVWRAVVKSTTDFNVNYNITWKNGSTTLKTDTVAKNAIPEYTGATPTKAATAQYTYEFIGWNTSSTATTALATIPAATKDETYYAVFKSTPRTYSITWMNGGSVYESQSLAYGAQIAKPADPTMSDENYTYTFKGWSLTQNGATVTNFGTVSSDKTYYAIYDKVAKTCTVVWNIENPLISKSYTSTYTVEGETITCDIVDPSGYVVEDGVFEFAGWKNANGTVVTNFGTAVLGQTVTFTAEFIWVEDSVRIIFRDSDTNSEIGRQYYRAGTTVNAPTPPAKTGCNFKWWSTTQNGEETALTTDNQTYFAVYELKEYTFKWESEGETFFEAEYQHGTSVSAPAGTPEKAEDEENTYTFSHWSASTNGATQSFPVTATTNRTFYAVFDATPKGE